MRIALLLVFAASPAVAREPGLKEALDASYEFPAGVNRGRAKRDAFQRGVGSASAGRVKSIIKQMKLMDKGMDNLKNRIVRLYGEYAKEQAKYDATIAAFHKKYGPDASVPITAKTGKNLDEARGRWTKATSIRRTEHAFEEWVVQRINEMIIVLRDDKRGAIISALAAGTRDRDRRQRARCTSYHCNTRIIAVN